MYLMDDLTEAELQEAVTEQRSITVLPCEGGDGPCPNACQCGCETGLFICECWS